MSRRHWGIGGLLLLLLALGVLALVTRSEPAVPLPMHPYFAARGERTGPWLIAHRGGMGEAPENTLLAFESALAAGADVLDMDVRTAADGALVVLHDASLERTTDGVGVVREWPLAELRTLDAGFHWSGDGGASFPFRGRGLRIPTLEEVFARFASTPMVIEIKEGGEELAQRLCAAVRRSGMGERVLVASYDEAATLAFRAQCPSVATGATFRESLALYLRAALGLPGGGQPAAEAFLVPIRMGVLRVLTPEFVAAARRVNARVQAFTANDDESIDALLRAGVDGIFTDHPQRLGARLRAPSRRRGGSSSVGAPLQPTGMSREGALLRRLDAIGHHDSSTLEGLS